MFSRAFDAVVPKSPAGLIVVCILQDQNPSPNVPRVPVSVPGPGVGAQPPNVSIAGNHNSAAYLNNQQQAAVMKQHQMLLDQQKQREQQKHLLMEQQKQQFFLGQRQQQLLAEQVCGAWESKQVLSFHISFNLLW